MPEGCDRWTEADTGRGFRVAVEARPGAVSMAGSGAGLVTGSGAGRSAEGGYRDGAPGGRPLTARVSRRQDLHELGRGSVGAGAGAGAGADIDTDTELRSGNWRTDGAG